MKIAGYDIDRAAKNLYYIRSLPRGEKNRLAESVKWDIAKFHFKNNDFYNNKLKNNLPKKWEELPIMQKTDYQQSINELLSNEYTKNNTYIANTSGSSGKPFFYAKNKSAHAITWALAEDRYKWHGIRFRIKTG